jgi:hypothetical protein
MAIGDHFVWDHPGALDRLAKERLHAGRLTMRTEQDIDDRTVLVDRTVEVELVPFAEEEDLVDEPPRTCRTSVASHLGRQLWSERLDPVEDGPMRDIDAALGQQLKHLTARQGVGQVPPYGRQDHVLGPAVAAEG